MTSFQAHEGNLSADPELKIFDDGNASVRFRLIDNPTHADRATGEIVKETPVAVNCVARGALARNISSAASKGDRLLVWGTPKSRKYTDRDGNERTADYLAVEAAGTSLRFTKKDAADAPEQETSSAPWPEAAQPGSGAAG